MSEKYTIQYRTGAKELTIATLSVVDDEIVEIVVRSEHFESYWCANNLFPPQYMKFVYSHAREGAELLNHTSVSEFEHSDAPCTLISALSDAGLYIDFSGEGAIVEFGGFIDDDDVLWNKHAGRYEGKNISSMALEVLLVHAPITWDEEKDEDPRGPFDFLSPIAPTTRSSSLTDLAFELHNKEYRFTRYDYTTIDGAKVIMFTYEEKEVYLVYINPEKEIWIIDTACGHDTDEVETFKLLHLTLDENNPTRYINYRTSISGSMSRKKLDKDKTLGSSMVQWDHRLPVLAPKSGGTVERRQITSAAFDRQRVDNRCLMLTYNDKDIRNATDNDIWCGLGEPRMLEKSTPLINSWVAPPW